MQAIAAMRIQVLESVNSIMTTDNISGTHVACSVGYCSDAVQWQGYTPWTHGK